MLGLMQEHLKSKNLIYKSYHFDLNVYENNY